MQLLSATLVPLIENNSLKHLGKESKSMSQDIKKDNEEEIKKAEVVGKKFNIMNDEIPEFYFAY